MGRGPGKAWGLFHIPGPFCQRAGLADGHRVVRWRAGVQGSTAGPAWPREKSHAAEFWGFDKSLGGWTCRDD